MIGLFIVFNIGYYVVFTFLPDLFHQDAEVLQDRCVHCRSRWPCLVALILILPLAALSDRIGRGRC